MTTRLHHVAVVGEDIIKSFSGPAPSILFCLNKSKVLVKRKQLVMICINCISSDSINLEELDCFKALWGGGGSNQQVLQKHKTEDLGQCFGCVCALLL